MSWLDVNSRLVPWVRGVGDRIPWSVQDWSFRYNVHSGAIVAVLIEPFVTRIGVARTRQCTAPPAFWGPDLVANDSLSRSEDSLLQVKVGSFRAFVTAPAVVTVDFVPEMSMMVWS